ERRLPVPAALHPLHAVGRPAVRRAAARGARGLPEASAGRARHLEPRRPAADGARRRARRVARARLLERERLQRLREDGRGVRAAGNAVSSTHETTASRSHTGVPSGSDARRTTRRAKAFDGDPGPAAHAARAAAAAPPTRARSDVSTTSRTSGGPSARRGIAT